MTVENVPARDPRIAYAVVAGELGWMSGASAEAGEAYPASGWKPRHDSTGRDVGLFPTEAMELCWPADAEPDEAGADIGDLIGMLAEDIETAIARTLEFRSPEPASRFSAHVIETDLLVALEAHSSEGGHETLGVTVAFMMLTGWLTRIRHRLSDVDVTGEVLGSVRALLGARCAEIAGKASGLLDDAGSPIHSVRQFTDDLGDDLLPALIWLASSLVQRYGNGDIAWLRQHY